MGTSWDLERLTQEWTARGLDRRDLFKMIATGGAGLAIATLIGTPAAGAAAARQEAAGGAQVSMIWRSPNTLSPLFSTAGSEQQVERLMFGSLIKMADNLDPIPDLAETVDVSDDATVYTFKLHQNATFSDGTPLTAADVVFTMERALDPRTGSYWRGRLLAIKGAEAYGEMMSGGVGATPEAEADAATTGSMVEGIATPDDYTVELTMSTPNAAFLVNLGNFSGLGILPKHVLESVAPDQMMNHPFSLAPNVSAGAFKFVTYETDQYLEVERNDTYWGTPPALERIFMRIVQPDIAVAELQNGNLDLMSISVDDIEPLSQVPNLTVVSVPSPSLDTISINQTRDYLADKRLGQAMHYALDRQAIVDELYRGRATVINSPIFGPDWMGIPEGLNEYPYDPEKAKALLAEMGWDANRTIQMMYVPSGDATFEQMVTVVQQYFGDAGLKVELLQVEVTELIRRLIQEGDYELYIGGGGVYRADPSISATYYYSKNLAPGGGNSVRYVNPELDALYDQGIAAPTQEERKAIYTEVAKILNEECPSVYLWSPESHFAFNNRLVGFQAPSYVDNRLWNAETWSVTE
jgi:peptide/nickel transport system substrate-binding protein